MAALLLGEMNLDYRRFRIEILAADSPLAPPPGAVVIDMRKLAGFR